MLIVEAFRILEPDLKEHFDNIVHFFAKTQTFGVMMSLALLAMMQCLP